MLTIEQEQCYDNLRVSRNAWDTNLVKVRDCHRSSVRHFRAA